MSRAKTVSKKRSSRRVPARRAAADALSARLPTDQRLTAEILEIDRANKTRVTRDVVAIGSRLFELQRYLGFGQWLAWLIEHLPYSPRTAQRYIALARWAADNAEEFEVFEHLGVGKLQVLAALPERARRRFRRQQRFQIPGSSARKTLEVMTLEELRTLAGGAGTLVARPPALPPAKVLQRFRHRVEALDVLADQVRANAAELAPEDIREAAVALQAVVDELNGVV